MLATIPTTAIEYQHIAFDDKKRPIIADTTMKIVELVEAQQPYGYSSEELHFQHPYLSMGQIHAALGYYWDRKAEMDAEIERRYEYAEQMRRESGPSPVAARLRAAGLLK